MKRALVLVVCVLEVVSLGTASFGEKNPPEGVKIISVMIKNAGIQRVPIKPVFLYSGERGWKTRGLELLPRELEGASSEEQSAELLTKFFLAAERTDKWTTPGRFGNTEILFYRDDDQVQKLVLSKESTTAAIASIESQLGTNSSVLRHSALINRSFPPAAREDVPDALLKDLRSLK